MTVIKKHPSQNKEKRKQQSRLSLLCASQAVSTAPLEHYQLQAVDVECIFAQ